MIYAIYRVTQRALDECMPFEEAEEKGEIDILAEFDTLEECEAAWNSGWYDEETHGYGGLLTR